MSVVEQIEERIDEFLDELVDEIFSRSQENLTKNKSIDTGFLRNSGNVNRKFLDKEIVYKAPYAASIEYGTDPHMPPVDALKGWSRRKLGNEKAAWAVAKKIAKEGTDPKPFLRPAIETTLQKVGGP